MSEEIRQVIISHLYDNLRGNPSRLLMLCRRLGHELVTLEDVNDELKALKDGGILEVHSAHRSNTVWILSVIGKEAEQVRRHNLSVGFTPIDETPEFQEAAAELAQPSEEAAQALEDLGITNEEE